MVSSQMVSSQANKKPCIFKKIAIWYAYWIVSYRLFAFPSQNSTHMYSSKAAPPWQATAMSAVFLD